MTVISLSNGTTVSIKEAMVIYKELGEALRMMTPNRMRRAEDAVVKTSKPVYELKEVDEQANS